MAKKDWIGTPAEPYYMNPEKCRELVEECGGNKSAAARAIGVNHTTLNRWLDPDFLERRRASMRRSGMTPEQAERARDHERKYRKENRSEILFRRRKRYWENPEKYRESSRQYAQRNPEKRREYRKENREKLRELERKYREENRDKVLERNNRWRASIRGQLVTALYENNYRAKKAKERLDNA